MILDEFAPRMPGWRVEVVATDISEAVLTRAKAGIYSQFEVQRGLSTAQLLKYFTQHREDWQLNQNIRSKVSFRHFNLLDDYSILGQFDVIFCRNVLIYFDPNRKSDVLNRMSRMLAEDGVIVLGASESVLALSTRLVASAQHRGFFQLATAAAPKASAAARR
jgi:chemotaxis protein methyltransferase CheR